jgi:hypothetical protein|tara:strand:+ start:699 stop:953 length:255 start_codon:yes stop_codon:yes gene_type:complete
MSDTIPEMDSSDADKKLASMLGEHVIVVGDVKGRVKGPLTSSIGRREDQSSYVKYSVKSKDGYSYFTSARVRAICTKGIQIVLR